MSTRPNAAWELLPAQNRDSLPPILVGNVTSSVERKVKGFYLSVADMFETWIAKRISPNTQRSYRYALMDFVTFLGIDWPDQAPILFKVRVADVQAYRDYLIELERAPKTVVHRISAVSGFYKYLREASAELRLPINVPNPAHSQFISRENADPVEETRSLKLAQARRLRTLPQGEDILAYRDRAILDFYLYSGARLATGCRLEVKDFRFDESDSKIRINEKGNKRRTIGIHHNAATSMMEYIKAADIRTGPLFRPRLNSRSEKLAAVPIKNRTMFDLLQSYLEKLPGARQQRDENRKSCIYSPHSIRATTATLLLDAGTDIRVVQELLGHKHVTTTEIYDKRRRASKDSASHDIPI